MFNTIIAGTILTGIFGLIYFLAKGLGQVTNIDDPLDDKFWKK